MLRSVVNQSFYRRLLASSVKNESGFVRSFASKSEERKQQNVIISDDNEWESFKAKHNKVYADEREEALRKTIFLDNLMKIKATNERADNGEDVYRLVVTKFADLTNEEFKATYLGFKKNSEQ